MGEMLARGNGIGEKTQRDPPGHEVNVRLVIRIGRRRRGAHDLIGGGRIAEIDELASQRAARAPPFVGVLTTQILRRGGERQLDRGRNVVLGRHNAAVNI